MVQGTKLTVDEQQTTDDSAVYRAEWVTTGLPKCKKGERQTLNLQMQVGETIINTYFLLYSELKLSLEVHLSYED